MQTRLVLWGKNSEEEQILVALDLLEEENQVEMWTFAHKDVSEEFFRLMMNEWRFGKQVSFPENFTNKKMDLTHSDDLLPMDIKVDKPDLVNRAKTEWQFVIASNKMFRFYNAEAEDLMDKVNSLERFSDGMWEEMKAFWSKVQKQITDRNLYGNHATTLRKKTDAIFDKLKELRRNRDAAFRGESEKRAQEFMDTLDEVEGRIEKGLGLKPIFEGLKDIQRDFTKTDMIREHKDRVFKRIDSLFKKVKKELFGETATGTSPLDKMKRRYNGLLNAMRKMTKSIERDEKDLYYENKRKENSHGQLEEQLREAKLLMIQERLNSKRNKLEDMHKTREEIKVRLKKLMEKEKEEQRRKELKQAEKEAAAKIQKSISERQENIDVEELKKAAETIKGKSRPVQKREVLPVENAIAVASLMGEEE